MLETITRVGLTHLQVPFKEPLRIANGEATVKDAVLVAVETADGLVGVGECSPLPVPESIGGGLSSIEACWRDLTATIGPGIVGQRFGTIEGIAALAARWSDCQRSAVAGVETALWDLLGHARGLSLSELMGASPEAIGAGVESGLTVGLYPTVVDLLRAIEPHMVEGYRRLKLKIRPGKDIEFVAAVRQQFGLDLELAVDGDGSYRQRDTEVLRELDEFDLLMIEQPMAADDLDGLAALQEMLATPICLDETARDLERTAEALERGLRPDRQPEDPAARRTRAGPGDARSVCLEGGRLLGRHHARAGRRPGTGHPPGHAAQLQVPDRRDPERPLVRRRLRRPADRDVAPRPC